MLCIEIIQSSQKINLPELESETKGMRYRSMRGLGRIIFEGSISFEDIMDTFKPLNFTKTLVLRGPYNQGKITIWVTKRFSFLPLKENSKLRIKISNMELEWNSM